MAYELLAWMQMLALDGPARKWEPKRLRLRLFTCAGRLVSGGRRLRLRLAASWPWTAEIPMAITRLQAPAPADQPELIPATRKDTPRARGTPLTRRGNRAARHDRTLKNSGPPAPQATKPRSRKMQARLPGHACRRILCRAKVNTAVKIFCQISVISFFTASQARIASLCSPNTGGGWLTGNVQPSNTTDAPGNLIRPSVEWSVSMTSPSART